MCCATSPKSGAYIAIHEWNILNAICIYLPTPLSGLIIDNSNSSINSSGSNEEYKMSLEDLPASFFELCANLCQIEEGKAHCFADGYLRRALDKLSIIHVHFMDWWRKVSVVRKLSSINIKAINRQLNSTPTPVFSDDIRAKVLACLHLIAKVSGYNDPRKGSANDVILNSFYSIVEVCRDLIDCQLIERNNPLIEAAFDVVAQLAVDTYRISVMMEKTNFFATIREQLQDCELLTSRSAELALSILRDSTLHLTSDYIFRMVPSIRMPVSKVMRVYPNLSDVVRDASWTLTKSVVIYRANVPEDSDIFHDPEAVAFDEFVRTGVPVLSPKGKAAKDFRNKISNKSIFEMNNSLLQKLVMEDHPINAVDAKNYSLGKNNVDGNLVSNLNNQESKLNEQSVPSSEYSDGNFEIYSEHYSEDFLSLENSAISENIVKEQFNIDGNKVADGFTIKKAKEAAGRRRSFVFVNSDGSIDKQSKPSSSSQGNLHASDGELCKNSIGSSNPNHENYLNESRNDFVQKNGMQSVGLMSILNSKSIPAIDRPSLLPQLDNRYLANADEYGNADKHVVPTKMGGGSTKPGTYTRCGVSSCGGLRTNVISAGHEEYYTKTKDEAEKELLQTNILHKGIDVLPVSQLSARDPALKELVHYRKGRMGFAELDKYDPNSSPSKTATAKKTKSKKMLNGSTSALQNSPLRKQKKEDFSNFWNADNRSEAGKVQASDVKIPTISIEELPELLITRPRK